MLSDYVNKPNLLWLLAISWFMIFAIVVISMIARWIVYRGEKGERKIFLKLQNGIVEACEKGTTDIPENTARYFRNYTAILLLVLEKMAEGELENFDKVKEKIVQKFLLPKARKWSNSFSCRHRDFACQIFALFAELQDEKRIKKLLIVPEGKITLLKLRLLTVQVQASFAAISFYRFTEQDALLRIVLELMAPSNPMRFIYKSAFMAEEKWVKPWLLKEIEIEKDPSLRVILLDLLSEMLQGGVLPYIKEDLHARDEKLRERAIEIFCRYSDTISDEVVKTLLGCPNPKRNKFVLDALANQSKEKSIPILAKLLYHPSWEISFRSALHLKRLGKEGAMILEEQKEKSKAGRLALAIPDSYKVGHLNLFAVEGVY